MSTRMHFVFLAAQELHDCAYVLGISEHNENAYLTVGTTIFPGSVFVTERNAEKLKETKKLLQDISEEAKSLFTAPLFIHQQILSGEKFVDDVRHEPGSESDEERVALVEATLMGPDAALDDEEACQAVISVFRSTL